MRAYPWFLAALAASCHPSATIERTMPVANLQTYRSVALRVQAGQYAPQQQAQYLEAAVADKLHRQCGFEQIGPAGSNPVDVVLDINITGSGRGGDGWMKNPNLATLDTLLVLTDGQTGDLLGTARIHGKSSGMVINNSVPENEAIDVVAKTIADLLAKSGCSGPRVAKAEPPPPPPAGSNAGSATTTTTTTSTTSTTTTPPPTGGGDEHRAEAEALNDQGKEKVRSADLAGALALFQKANSLVADARYEYNICLVLEAQQQWDAAVASCEKAKTMNAAPELRERVQRRLELIRNHQ